MFVRSCIPQTSTRESGRESLSESNCQIWSTSIGGYSESPRQHNSSPAHPWCNLIEINDGVRFCRWGPGLTAKLSQFLCGELKIRGRTNGNAPLPAALVYRAFA